MAKKTVNRLRILVRLSVAIRRKSQRKKEREGEGRRGERGGKMWIARHKEGTDKEGSGWREAMKEKSTARLTI